jgi:hypothetical protein
LICAALGDHCHLSASRFSELGLVVRGENLHFRDRVRINGDVSTTVVPVQALICVLACRRY